ncbi:hypothetical protein M9Y10_011293 [Tritrichomonas musculus]|uniref:Protein kinase domain-containing protein n=1 Tax=Tritrichomonas musculus TaxID=1915356 RepID=A0ABR2IJ18_9EUKA
MSYYDTNEDNLKEDPSKSQLDVNIIRDTLSKNGFVFLRPVGKGGFASVFLIFSNQYNLNFVVKVSDYKGSRKSNSQDFDLTEINHLINLNHPNIINMYKYFTDDHYLYIVLEYCEGGSLDDLVKQNGPIRPPTLYNYCYQILTALKHCHDLQIAHSDIKPANVLIDKNGRLKLADFGLSKGFSPKLFYTDGENPNATNHLKGKNGEILTKKFGGSKPYMSPELIQLTAYDPFKADIWSLGVTFYQLSTGRLPWNTLDPKEMRMSIIMGIFSFQNTKLPPAFCNIIHRMLEVKPSKRATLNWLLEQSLFNQPIATQDRNPLVCRSPSFGSQLNSLNSLNSFTSNVNSFKLGNRKDKIKLNHRRRNNSSLILLDRNQSFSTFSSNTGDDGEIDAQFKVPNAVGTLNNKNNRFENNQNLNNSGLKNGSAPNLELQSPNIQNIFSSDPNLPNAKLQNSSSLNTNFPNQSQTNFRNKHLLIPNNFKNIGSPPIPQEAPDNNSNNNFNLNNNFNNNNFQQTDNFNNFQNQSGGAALAMVTNQKQKILRGKNLPSPISAQKTFL